MIRTKIYTIEEGVPLKRAFRSDFSRGAERWRGGGTSVDTWLDKSAQGTGCFWSVGGFAGFEVALAAEEEVRLATVAGGEVGFVVAIEHVLAQAANRLTLHVQPIDLTSTASLAAITRLSFLLNDALPVALAVLQARGRRRPANLHLNLRQPILHAPLLLLQLRAHHRIFALQADQPLAQSFDFSHQRLVRTPIWRHVFAHQLAHAVARQTYNISNQSTRENKIFLYFFLVVRYRINNQLLPSQSTVIESKLYRPFSCYFLFFQFFYFFQFRN